MTVFTKSVSGTVFGDGTYATAETKTYADLETYTYEGFGALHGGALANTLGRTVAGGVTPAGSVVRSLARTLVARLPALGNLTSVISHYFTGGVIPAMPWAILPFKTDGIQTTVIPKPLLTAYSTVTEVGRPYASSVEPVGQPYASSITRGS